MAWRLVKVGGNVIDREFSDRSGMAGDAPPVAAASLALTRARTLEGKGWF
jgi:hypothetical protein